jgi:hypothetical protein
VAAGRAARLALRADAARERRQRARVGWPGRSGAAQRRGQPVAEEQVGDDAVAGPEALAGEEVLERAERPARLDELERSD